MSTITPLSSIPQLGSSTDRTGGQQQSLGQKMIGEILKATVLGERANNHYLLDFGGTKIPVSSQSKLSAGQVLQLELTQISPHVELKIVSEASSLLTGKSLALLGNSINLSQLVSSLQQGSPSPLSQLSAPTANILQSFLPPELTSLIGSNEGGVILQQMFNRLGINLEQLLAQGRIDNAQNTVKTALLEIISQFQGSERISEQANKILATIELYQFSQIQLTNQNLLIFPLPLPFVEQGYLLIEDYDKEDQETSETGDNQKFSLHLSMSELGDIQINFLQNSDTLFIKILFDSEEKVLFASQFKGLLEEMLSSRNELVISFSSGAESPAHALAQKLFADGQSFIDTKV